MRSGVVIALISRSLLRLVGGRDYLEDYGDVCIRVCMYVCMLLRDEKHSFLLIASFSPFFSFRLRLWLLSFPSG